MNNFYKDLKQNLNWSNDIKKSINIFNELDDEEIKALFEDNEITPDIKTAIVEIFYNRIEKLPFNIFALALFYMENSYLLTINYKNRIENLTIQELSILLYDANLDGNCLIEITKMDVFKKYLNDEKENKMDTKLQSFELLKELYLHNDNIDELNNLGKRIVNLLKTQTNYTEDIQLLIDYYLGRVIERNNEISVDSEINFLSLSMMNHCLKNHEQLSEKLTEFYILFRIKDLEIDHYCKKVIISTEDSDNSVFGYFSSSIATLKIFYHSLKKRFAPFIKKQQVKDKNTINDFLNLIQLKAISHELEHIKKTKEIAEFQAKSPTYEEFKTNTSVYYWYKNGLLHSFLGEEKYYMFHQKFINEVRADIFSIFDSSIQINKYFKDCFPKILLQNLCKMNACDIINFYTKKENHEEKRVTPMQQFDEFLNLYLPQKENSISIPNTEIKNKEQILNDLLLGDQIPEYVLEEIAKIASGEITTTDIYEDVLSIINKEQISNSRKTVK